MKKDDNQKDSGSAKPVDGSENELSSREIERLMFGFIQSLVREHGSLRRE